MSRAAVTRIASAALVIAIGALVVKLALGPLYDRYDADECRAAYERARTRGDTVAVDFQPYASPFGGRNPRCGETRVHRPDSTADVFVAGPPHD